MTVDDCIENPTDTLVSRDVVTGSRLAAFPILTDDEVDRAVHNARAAEDIWSAAGFAARRRAMLDWAREIVARSDDQVHGAAFASADRAAFLLEGHLPAMKSRSFVHHAETRANAGVVADLVDDVDGWSAWTRPLLLRTAWERWGNPAPAGVGAVRRLGMWPFVVRELITSYDRGRSQEYTVLAPHLFTAYVGAVTLSRKSDGGTRISWSVDFTPRFSVLGRITAFALSRVIGSLTQKLARTADTKAAPQAVSI